MLVAQNKVVTIDYTLKDNDGKILDQSQNGEFAYLHGASNIIPGLENALLDKKTGEIFFVSVPPEMGYGEHSASLSQVVSMDMFDSADSGDGGTTIPCTGRRRRRHHDHYYGSKRR